MKKFNFFEKLWEHGRTLRRVGLVLVMCLITIPQAWAYNVYVCTQFYTDYNKNSGRPNLYVDGFVNESSMTKLSQNWWVCEVGDCEGTAWVKRYYDANSYDTQFSVTVSPTNNVIFATATNAGNVKSPRHYDGATYIYWKVSGDHIPSWWKDDSRQSIQLRKNDNTVTGYVEGESIGENIYRYLVPEGDYVNIEFKRYSYSDYSGAFAFNDDASYNEVYDFGHNGHWGNWSRTYFAKNAYIYMDNTASGWATNSGYNHILIGRAVTSVYSITYHIGKISNTNLLCYDGAFSFNDYNQLCFIHTEADDWGEDKSTSPGARKPYAANHTNEVAYLMDGGSKLYNLFTPDGAGSGESYPTPSHSSASSYGDLLHSTQRVYTAAKTTGTYSETNSKAQISLSSYKLSNATTSTTSSATLSTSESTDEITAVKTATTTLTCDNTIAAGYQFDGWYDAANGGTRLQSAKTYSYATTGATTVYARFSAKSYTITLNDGSGSGGDGTHSVTYDAAVGSLTNTPTRTNYVFCGYETSGHVKIFNANLTPVSSVSGYTDGSGNWIYDGDITLNAIWEDKWNIKGSNTEMGGWSTYNGMPNVSSNTFQVTLSLVAGTTYDFKIVKRADGNSSNDVFYGKSGSVEFTRSTRTSAKGMTTSDGEQYNMQITADVSGSYDFTMYDADGTSDNMQLSIKYPCLSSGAGKVVYKFVVKSDVTEGNVCATDNTDYPQTIDGNKLSTLAGGTLTARGNGTESHLQYDDGSYKYSGSNFYLKVVTDCPLQTGDVIRYINFGASNSSVAMRLTENNSTNEIVLGGNGASTIQTATVTSSFNGQNTFYIDRNTNTPYLSYFEIIRPVTITLNASANEGKVKGENTVDLKQAIGDEIILPHALKSNAHFTGWYANQSGGDPVSTSYTVTGGTTLYAQWEDCPSSGTAFKFQVKNGLTNGATGITSLTDINIGNYVSILDGGQLSAYASNASYLSIAGTNSFSFENNGVYLKVDLDCALQTGDTIISTLANKPFIVNASSSGNSATPKMELATGTKQKTVVPAAMNNATTIYIWRKESNTPSPTISYFEIKRPATYTISYAAGSADGASGSLASGTKTHGVNYTLSSVDNAFSRDGYTYDGWSTNEDGSTQDYAFGATYSTNADLTLYPYWVADAPSCATPTDPTNGTTRYDSQAVSWTAGGEETSWEVYYSTTNSTPAADATPTASPTSASYTFTGLSASTDYYWWVRAACDEDNKSDWVAGTSFTTSASVVITGAVNTAGYGTVTSSITVTSGSSVSLSSNVLTCDGKTLTATPSDNTAQYTYAFTSWSGVTNGGTVSSATTATANFSRTTNTYTITWENYDGSTLETDENVEYGATPSYNGEDPTKASSAEYDYTFDAWYPTPSSVTGDATYTATFSQSEREYTLTWDVNGGDDLTGEYTHGTVAYGTTITKPSDPTRSGYDFAGWDVTPAGTMPAANTTYTAQWAEQFTVTYDPMQGSCATDEETGSSINPVTLPTPSHASYSFLGWYTSAGVLVGDATAEYTPTADITLYAKWAGSCAGGGGSETIISVTISSNADNTSGTSASGTIGGTAYWKDLNGSGPYKLNVDNSSYVALRLATGYFASTDQLVITGADKHHYVYTGTHGSGSPLGVTDGPSDEVITYTLTDIPANTSEIYVYRPSSKTTYNGKVTSMSVTRGGSSCYTVTYNGNNATGGYVSDPAQYESGTTVYVYDAAGSYTRTGYEFNGWNTKADGSGTKLSSFTITRDTTLYAQWRIVISSDNTNFEGKDTPTAYKDVKVTNGATLTLTQDTEVRDITIETGSTLNVSTNSGSPITLTTNSLSLVGGWNDNKTKYDMPRVYIDPASKITREEKDINFDIAVDNSNYYPIAVPFEVSMSDVTYKNPTLASAAASRYGTIYAVKTYNGANRANGTSPTWSLIGKDKTLKPGHGYILCAVPAVTWGEQTAVIRFPMKNVPDAALAAGELGRYSTTIKDTVKITAYRQDGDTDGKKTPPSNTGWNLIAVPYMSCYTTSAGMTNGSNVEEPATIITGRINFDNGKWVDDGIQYVTVPKYDFSEYIQAKITDDDTITTLLPGWCFFVQVAETGNLRFLSESEAESGSWPIYAPKRDQEYKPTLNTGIILTGNGAKDKTNFLISDEYSAAEYEINADLEKMFGENSFTLATYSLSGETRLAYNALSNADAANIIPIGYRAPADGEYTFSINPRYAESEAFEHVNLIDYETGIMTDLLMGSYTFSTERTQLDTRFALNVVPRKDTPTDIENGASGINDANGPRKVLINDKMYIIIDGKMYDATGKAVK